VTLIPEFLSLWGFGSKSFDLRHSTRIIADFLNLEAVMKKNEYIDELPFLRGLK